MIYLICVVRGLLDPVFSFKDEHESEQDSEIKEERPYSGIQSRLLGDYRVVTRYMGSGITAPGSGITSRGIWFSSTLRGSGIRFLSGI